MAVGKNGESEGEEARKKNTRETKLPQEMFRSLFIFFFFLLFFI